MSTLPPLRLLDDMIRINKDGSISVGILTEDIPTQVVETVEVEKPAVSAPAEVKKPVRKPVRKPAVKKTVKK